MASEDIASVRRAADLGLDVVWVGERCSSDSPARLAALAAGTGDIDLGLGLLPLTAPEAARAADLLSTARLVAPGRIRIGFELPAMSGADARRSWRRLLREEGESVRTAGVPLAVGVADVAGAVLAAEAADVLVLRAADPALTERVVTAAAASPSGPAVEVWLDGAAAEPPRPDGSPRDAADALRGIVADRLAIPGVPGHETTREVARRLGPAGLRGGVESRYASGLPQEAMALVPDALVAATCLLAGSIEDRLDEYATAGVARVCLRPLGRTAEDRMAALERFALAPTL